MIIFAFKIAFVASILNLIISNILPKIMKLDVIKNNIKKPDGPSKILFDVFFGENKNMFQLTVLSFLIILITLIVLPPTCDSVSTIS